MNDKTSKFLLITTIISLIFIIVGATFSYFTVQANSRLDAVTADAGKVSIGLSVSPLYTGHKIIPLREKDINIAYQQKCIDDFGYGACLAYNIEIFNFNLGTEVEGKIDYTIEHIANLSYMVFDENGDVYQDITHIDSENSLGMSLGKPFTLEDASENKTVSKKFVLLIWLTEIEEKQDEVDAGGTFTGDITYTTSEGGRLTATIDGVKAENNGE